MSSFFTDDEIVAGEPKFPQWGQAPLPPLAQALQVSNVFVGCVTVNNSFHRPVAAP